MKTFNGIVNIEVEFEFTETHPPMPAQIDSQGQGICPPAPPEWELEGFTIGGVDLELHKPSFHLQSHHLCFAVAQSIESHINQNYVKLTK